MKGIKETYKGVGRAETPANFGIGSGHVLRTRTLPRERLRNEHAA